MIIHIRTLLVQLLDQPQLHSMKIVDHVAKTLTALHGEDQAFSPELKRARVHTTHLLHNTRQRVYLTGRGWPIRR